MFVNRDIGASFITKVIFLKMPRQCKTCVALSHYGQEGQFLINEAQFPNWNADIYIFFTVTKLIGKSALCQNDTKNLLIISSTGERLPTERKKNASMNKSILDQ